jgi:hypothetical protein
MRWAVRVTAIGLFEIRNECTNFCHEKLSARDHLGDLDVDGEI